MYIRLFKVSVLNDTTVLHLQKNLIAEGLLEILQLYNEIQKRNRVKCNSLLGLQD